ncbi:hypothetical protein [Pluralibacter sp.]|jgi:hypothetical protein|uniref:hypothetical protein n=1 Tax=Pluralibacter sp. TaxID=1920032 RepID=UPI0025CC50E8|nr:hypothetical protein [Pluralibacter sp.]MBV8044455.1 hypothetical protein [Pluralibacter sp.]
MIAKSLTLITLLVVWFIVVAAVWSLVFPLEWVLYLDGFLVSHSIHIYGEHEFGDERIYDFMADLTLVSSALLSIILTLLTYRLIRRK